MRFAFGPGAATTALPLECGEGIKLEQEGLFIVANGEPIPNYGRVEVHAADERGANRAIGGSVSEVHRPQGSASGIAAFNGILLFRRPSQSQSTNEMGAASGGNEIGKQ